LHARDESNSSETGMKAAGMTYGTSARQEGNGGGHPSGAARRGTKARPAGGSRADDEGREGRGAGGSKRGDGGRNAFYWPRRWDGTVVMCRAIARRTSRSSAVHWGGVRMGPVRRQGARPRQRRQRGPEKPQGGRGGPQAWPRRCAWDEEGGYPIVNTRAGKRSGWGSQGTGNAV
jgi:hypothetical protein